MRSRFLIRQSWRRVKLRVGAFQFQPLVATSHNGQARSSDAASAIYSVTAK
jgi:hypothetical protein